MIRHLRIDSFEEFDLLPANEGELKKVRMNAV
jgi:hypothetical protein